MLSLLLAACRDPSTPEDPSDPTGSDTAADPTDPTDPTPTESTPTGQVDPDVSNYLPEGYVPVEPTRILFLGDSITEGYGASSASLKYTALLGENSPQWPGFDEVDFETTYPTLTEVVDVSEGGATTGLLLSRQLPDLEEALTFPVSGETIVVITIAGNDLQAALIPFANAEVIVDRALENFGVIADYFLDPAKFPDGVYLYATNVYEPTDGVGQSQSCFFGVDYSEELPQLDRFNAELAAMGEERGFAVLDLRGHFLGHGYYSDLPQVPNYDASDPTLWFASDCIHPNDRGHHELRRLVHAAVLGEELEYRLPE